LVCITKDTKGINHAEEEEKQSQTQQASKE
jgi:hypothetical protein